MSLALDLDGNAVASDSEAFRHACEVRHVAAMTEPARVRYCEGVMGKRQRGMALAHKAEARAAAVRIYRDALAYLARSVPVMKDAA